MSPERGSLAVITGASAGIGREFAVQLARRGHDVLLISRDGARLQALASELAQAHGVAARVLAADLANEAEIERVARVLEAEPNVGIIVNNAGFGLKGRIHETPAEPQMQMLRLHMMAPMRLTRAVLPGMVARGRGWVINVSSVAAFMHGPDNVNYCATKSYLNRFSQALDTEVFRSGVVVQALCPGFTHTEFHARADVDKRTIAGWLWGSAEQLVSRSIAAAERGRPVVYVPGVLYKALALGISVMPQFMFRRARGVTKRVGTD